LHVDKPKQVGNLVGGSLKVITGTAQVKLLHELVKTQPELTWIEVDDIATEELIEQVDAGEADYILADSHEIALQRRYFPELRIAFELGQPRQLRWAYNFSDDDSLTIAIDAFFRKIEADGRLEQLIHRHYSHVAKFNYSDVSTFAQRIESHLPRYESLFRKEAEVVDLDWRLLAAIGYQESHWRSQAVSPTGVRGIMMLTQDTADYLGLDDRLDPKNSIFGGAQYYARQTERVADTVDEPDRTWMALAAYNVGFNHIKDARQIVEWEDGNPDIWLDISAALPLLAERSWYSRVPYGYARGWEPVLYVNNIRSYYNILKWLTEKEERLRTRPGPDVIEPSVIEPAVEKPPIDKPVETANVRRLSQPLNNRHADKAAYRVTERAS
jgi:membrane-bound lytic murein transglycosylase F